MGMIPIHIPKSCATVHILVGMRILWTDSCLKHSDPSARV